MINIVRILIIHFFNKFIMLAQSIEGMNGVLDTLDSIGLLGYTPPRKSSGRMVDS